MGITGVHAIPPGQKLGQYEIVTPLTSGGMAAVYLGRAVGAAGFVRHVAIKVVHPRFADDPQFIAMFLDEARLSSRIEHANVVRVEALGQEQGLYYLVMEYIRGAPLNLFVRRLAEKKRILLPELVVHIMANVADGLHAAHETTDDKGNPLGIVHRDVTPQNVLVSYAGAIKLIDFGIAKAAGRSQHTAKGAIKGKLRYMAPEQAAGKPVDRRTDVFALGIVLWEMLTYKKLFSGRTDAELMYMVREPKITPIRQLAPSVSESLEAVVMQALSVSPDERFQTAAALRRALYEACPKARSIDAQELSVLVRGTMAGDIANDQRTLPPSVVSSGEMIPVANAAREEAAMTMIVQAVQPLDDHEDASAPGGVLAEPPANGSARSGHERQRTASRADGSIAPPAPPVVTAIVPPPANRGIAETRMAISRPEPVAAPAPMPAPMASFSTTPMPAPMAARMSTPTPMAARPPGAFTPPNATSRSEVMSGRASLPSAAPVAPRETAPPRRSSRAGLFLMIAIAVVITIAVGGVGGWFAIHQANQMMQSP